MSEKQKQIIGECLKAAASGQFFPDWEFPLLFGLERAEVSRIAANWPNVDQSDGIVILAINNSLNNLLGYPIDRPREWSKYLSVSHAELNVIFDQWRGEGDTLQRLEKLTQRASKKD